MAEYKYIIKQIPDTVENAFTNIFMDYAFACSHGGVDLSLYLDAASGEISAASPLAACEKLYMIYNTQRPEGYTGRSMSVSDIVSLTDGNSAGLWYCDSFGFADITAAGKNL